MTANRPDLSTLAELAQDIARESGSGLLQHFGSRDLAIHTKSSSVDLVTAADLASEQLIVQRIREARPLDGVLSEEMGRVVGVSNIEWIIDPLDGTTNFSYGRPDFAVSIAIRVGGVLRVGVVYQPTANEMFTAATAGGAFCNGVQLKAPDSVSLSEALIANDFSYQAALRRIQAGVVARLLPHVRDVRRFGSPVLDLCHLAAGRLDGLYDFFAHPWDFAAGAVIAREAGAVVTDFDGCQTYGSIGVADDSVMANGIIVNGIVCATPSIAEELRILVRRFLNDTSIDRDLRKYFPTRHAPE